MRLATIEEIFRHEDVDGTVLHFSVPRLRAMILREPGRWTLTTMPVDRAQDSFVMRNRGVEQARLRAYPLSKLDEPGIGCIFPDGSLLTVDGNHRLVNDPSLKGEAWRGELF